MRINYTHTVNLDLDKDRLKSKIFEAFENCLLNKTDACICNKKIYISISYFSKTKCSCYIEILNTYLRNEFTLKEFKKIINKEFNLYFK